MTAHGLETHKLKSIETYHIGLTNGLKPKHLETPENHAISLARIKQHEIYCYGQVTVALNNNKDKLIIQTDGRTDGRTDERASERTT